MRLFLSVWNEAWRDILPGDVQPPSETETRAQVREVFESVEVEIVVAELAGIVAGRATFGASRDSDARSDVGELRSLLVDHRHWRRGVGRALVAHVLERLGATGRREVTLWSLADSDQATAFYAAQGFVRDGHTQNRDAFGHAPEVRWRRGLEGG